MEGGRGEGLPVMNGRTQIKQTARTAFRVLHTPNVQGFVTTQTVTIAIAKIERSVAYDIVMWLSATIYHSDRPCGWVSIKEKEKKPTCTVIWVTSPFILQAMPSGSLRSRAKM